MPLERIEVFLARCAHSQLMHAWSGVVQCRVIKKRVRVLGLSVGHQNQDLINVLVKFPWRIDLLSLDMLPQL